MFGAADVILAGDGTNSIIGGVGSDTLTAGNGIDNILLGDNGEIVQSFSSSGALVRNADGALHRDIVTEEIAQVIATVLLDDTADVGATNAAAVVGASLVMLAGAFNADGTQVMLPAGKTRPIAAWQVEAILLSLSADGNDVLTSGGGNGAVLIGQGGNNTLTAKGGSDYLFGNYASSTSPFASDIPFIVNAYVIAASPGDATIAANLPAGGLIVTPSINLQPSALTYENPQITLPPPGFGTLAGLAEGQNIRIGGGQSLQVFASLVPSALNGSPGLPGSNIINGGSGNDVIFGNFGQIGAYYSTGIGDLDRQMANVSQALMGVLANVSALSSAQYMLNAVNSGSTATASIAFANNTIVVGSGHNLVFGNAGFLVEPGIAFARSATGSLLTDAVNLDTYLLDMEEVAADTSAALQQLGTGVLASFSATTAGQQALHGGWWNARWSNITWWCDNLPGVLNLQIGNDTITATQGGDNVIVGDAGYYFLPAVNASTYCWADGQSWQTISSVDKALDTLEWNFNGYLQKELCYDFTYDTRLFCLTDPLLEYRGGIQVTMGNDVINVGGTTGADIVIGDSALLTNIIAGPGASKGQIASAGNTNGVACALLNGADSVVNGVARNWGADSNQCSLQNTSLFSAANFIFTGDDSRLTINHDTITVRCDVDLAYAGSGDLNANGCPDPKNPANYFGFTGATPDGPWYPHEDNLNGGVSGGLFFARLGKSTVIAGPNLVGLLGAGRVVANPSVTAAKATQVALVPVALETLPPMAASSTGAALTYFNANLFPPLDPVAPPTAKVVGFAATGSGGVAHVRTAKAAPAADFRIDVSAAFGETALGRSQATIRAFIDSEIAVASVAEDLTPQGWVFDDEAGVLTLHAPQTRDRRRRAAGRRDAGDCGNPVGWLARRLKRLRATAGFDA